MPTIEQLEKLLALDPADTFVLYALAQEHAKAKDHTRAVERYTACIEADETYCYAYYHMARSLEAMSRLDDAIATLETGLAIATHEHDAKASSEIREYLGRLRRSVPSR